MEIKYLTDVDWPWTSDKAMVACKVCGIGMFIYLESYDPDIRYIAVHDGDCLRKAKEVEASMNIEKGKT